MTELFSLNMVWAAVVAALAVLVTGPFLIPQLHKLKFGQSISLNVAFNSNVTSSL